MDIGFLDKVFNRNKEIEYILDLDLLGNTSQRVYMKRLAIDICINFLARTISQSEFRVKQGNRYIQDELYYRLNVRPNKNMTASMFWQKIIYKLVYDNECLIIQADDDDLLVADSYVRNKYAVFEDTFTEVVVDGYEFKRSFPMSRVLFFEYNNESLIPLINELFHDYGELFGRILNAQKRKGQIRSTVKLDTISSKTKESVEQLQNFINKMYKAIEEKDIAIVPEQKGIEYNEHSGKTVGNNQSVEEVNKVTDGFLDKVAIAMGIPPGLLYGDIADSEGLVKNYMVFTVKPLIKKISDETNSKFFTKEEFLSGKRIDVRPVSYQNIFDVATAVDKLRASGVANGNELRDELGLERVDNPMMDEYYITKNYQTISESFEGGEDE